MNVPTLDETREVYELARSVEFSFDLVDDEEIHRFSDRLRGIERELRLRDAEDSPFWTDARRRLRVARYLLAGVPITASEPALGLHELLHRLREQVAHAEGVTPDLAAHLADVVDALDQVVRRDSSPIADRAHALLTGAPVAEKAILLHKPRHIAAVEAAFANDGARVLTERMLMTGGVYGTLVVIGPLRWFPSVSAAPRASRIHVVTFRWVREEAQSAELFIRSRTRIPSSGVGHPTETRADEIEPDVLLPITEWSSISQRGGTGTEEASVSVEANLILLAGGLAAYIDAQEITRVYVLDSEAEDEDRIRQEDAAGVGVGAYVLLRTEGAGDDIAEMADRLLGDDAERLRSSQRKWKESLRETVRRDGTQIVVQRLRGLGGRLASEGNVRRWMWRGSLRTQYPEDFRAIMRLIGLEQETDRVWDEMGLLRRAHRKAGQRIRKMLLGQVRQTDLSPLVKFGRMDFEIPELEGGKLTAFRIEEKSPETYEVSELKLNRPFAVEKDVWLG